MTTVKGYMQHFSLLYKLLESKAACTKIVVTKCRIAPPPFYLDSWYVLSMSVDERQISKKLSSLSKFIDSKSKKCLSQIVRGAKYYKI